MFFKGQVSSWPDEKLNSFVRDLLLKVKVGLLEVVDERIARQIFVSTNLHGLRLSRTDVLKGQLMDIALDEAGAETIARKWAQIQQKANDQLDPLLVAVDFISRRAAQGVDCLTQLGMHIQRTCTPPAVLSWLDNLDRYADAWLELHDKIEYLRQGEIDPEIWKLRFFEWSEWKPLALIWYRDFVMRRGADGRVPPRTYDAFKRRFRALHRRCLALTLGNFDPNERALIIGKAIAQTGDGKNPLTHALAFNQNAIAKMRQTLTVPMTDASVRRTTVKWIEASLWKDRDRLPWYVGSATVEHGNHPVSTAGSVLFKRPG